MYPREDKIRRPYFDATQKPELCLCEKQFRRDNGHLYFGAWAEWVGRVYHRNWAHIVERITELAARGCGL